MRGYVNLCERRRVLGERICEFSVEKSYSKRHVLCEMICESLWKSQGYSDSKKQQKTVNIM